MSLIRKTKLTSGLYVVEIREADLMLCCGCPPDTTKYLKKAGFLNSEDPFSFPGAILLSDSKVQNGRLTNFAEFPIMELLYIRGMINNVSRGGELPTIIGRKEVVDSQVNYLCRGNYGYYSLEEMLETGIDKELCQKYWDVKLHFADGKIHLPDELCIKLNLHEERLEIKNQVFISRRKEDQFLIEYKNEQCIVDFHPFDNSDRELPYLLEDYTFKFSEFSIIHSGEGNGWEPENPCMGSLLIHQGKIFAIDSGPGFFDIVNHLGLDVQDVDGVFLTHIHDDHFAGITDLLKSTKRLKLFCSKLVMATVIKKFTELLDLNAHAFGQFFECHELLLDEWNNINGLKVKPFFSPHPIETNAFIFKCEEKGLQKLYGHLADTFSIGDLESLYEKNILTRAEITQIVEYYHLPCDVKKVDVGGGAIHGDKTDYFDDLSGKVVFSHNEFPSVYSGKNEVFGSSFGHQDILVAGDEEYFLKGIFFEIMKAHLAEISREDVDILFSNGKLAKLKRGETIEIDEQKVGFIIHGNLIRPNVSFKEKRLFDRSCILGLNEFFNDSNGKFLVNTSVVTMIILNKNEFIVAVKKFDSWKLLKDKNNLLRLLFDSTLFKHNPSSETLFYLAKNGEAISFEEDYSLSSAALHDLYFIISGKVEDRSSVTVLGTGDYFGGHQMFEPTHEDRKLEYSIKKGSLIFKITKAVYEKVPMINWMIYEKKTLSEIQKKAVISPMQEELIEAFNKSDLFKVLDVESQINVSKLVHRIRVKAGDIIVREGEASDRLFLIVNGIGVVKKGLANEPEKILAYLMPGNSFGEVGILENKPRSATVSALTDAELIEIPSHLFEELLMKFPRLGIELSKLLGYYLTQTNNRITRGNKENHLIAVFKVGAVASGLEFSQSISDKVTEQTGHPTVFIHHAGASDSLNLTNEFVFNEATNSYDTLTNWSELNFPKNSRISMTADRLLNTYNNLIIYFENIPDENLSIIFENLNQVIIISDEENWFSAIKLREYIKGQSTHRNVEFFMLKELINSGNDQKISYQFPEKSEVAIGTLTFLKTVKLIADRLERNNRVGIFIPTTINVNQKVDTSEFVNEALKFLGETFGGATSEEAIGVWNSKDIGIVDEKVFIVHSYTTAKVLKENLNGVVEFVKKMKDKLKQESMALEINKRLTLI